jgi:hypothetical protein
MASSGTYAFNLDVGEIIEEAFERTGLEDYTGYDYRTARRSLNLLLTEWINRGLNLWTLDLATQALSTGTSSYTLSTETLDVLDAVIRDGGDSTDTIAERIGIQEYLKGRSDKTTAGKPTQFAVERNSNGGHTLYVYPVPDDSTDTFLYWRIRYMEDVSATGGNQNVEVPKRFLESLVAGLSYQIALKKLKTDQEGMARISLLKADYEACLQRAKDEDRERASFFVTPYVGRI